MKTLMLLSMAFTIAFFQETYSKQVVDQVCNGDVTLSSQAEVDAFNCTEVMGSLHIFGQGITNLNSLALLKKVSGGLMISNTNLETLDELSALDTVGSGLSIRNNSALLSLSGFNNMTRSGEINISNNPKLVSITGFNSLAAITTFRGDPANLTIEQNDALTNLEGFSALKQTANFRIINNRKLFALDGFPSLRFVVEDVEIIDNESLKTIDGFKVLQSVGSYERFSRTGFIISNNASLETFAGLSSLESVLGDLTQISISNNPSLKNLDGLSSLTTIYGESGRSFEISNNAVLENIDGLSALRAAGSLGTLSIKVSKNPSLTRCNGLLPYFASLGREEVLRLASLGIIYIAENGAGCTVEDILGSDQIVRTLTVIDKRNGEVVRTFDRDSVTLDSAHPDISNWAIQANTFPQQVGSVEFIFDEQFTATTNVFPYTLELPRGLAAGIYTVTANVYSEAEKQGEQGIGITTVIKVIDASCPGSTLTGDPDATSVKLHWPPYSGSETLGEYRIKRNGIAIGSTIGKYGYFTDFGLSPDSTYSYSVEVVASNENILCQSKTIHVRTTTKTTIKTHYKLLAIIFDPNGESQGEFEHRRTYLHYRLDFLKYASHNTANLDIYNNDIITINAHPPLQSNSNNVDYARLAVTSYPELDNNAIVDLVERYDVDVVWVVVGPSADQFAENVLIGNKDLGNVTWVSLKVKCSRSFFIHAYEPDARAFDAAAHHVEGTMTSATEGSTENWPRDKEFLVYKADRGDFSVYPTKLHLWGRFRLTDEWNGRYDIEGHLSNPYASKGNASCGSSHFVPGSIRSSAETSYADYTYYDIKAWQRYVDCYADEWLTYPKFSGKSRKINGYDYGAFNNYQENGSAHSFVFGTSSFHQWWFNHIPHNPGVNDGKLNNWWPYIYDCNRFDGSTIDYPVDGFPVIPMTYSTTNEEYGTEETGSDLNWMYWHTNTDFGQRADLSIVSKSENPEYVKNGKVSTKVDVKVESFSINGRNDLIYPRYKNAHWVFSYIDTITFSIKLNAQQLIIGTNPIIRLCKNGNNRIEFVPKKEGRYTNFFNDNTLKGSDGWYTFRIPISGNASWEKNIIGYVDPALSPIDQEHVKQQIIKNILEDVNYFEVSIQSDGSRGESLVYYIDNLNVHTKDTTQVPQTISSFSLINHKTGAVIQEFENEITINVADPKFSHLMLQANTAPQQVGSVEFIFDGHIRRTENGFPYQFILPVLTPGTHTVRAEVYSKGQKQGVKGVGRTATFKVINSATIISFDVYNLSRQPLMTLHDGDKINIKDPAFKTFLFRANTTPTFVSKVEFFLNNRLVAVETGFPYELLVNRPPGDYTLEAIPYIRIGGNYYAGTSLKISFKIVSEDTGASGQLVMNDLSNEESLPKVGESPGVTIFPVPVDRELYIKIDDAAGKDPVITIRTIYGLTVYQDSYSKSQSINTLHLPAGVYYLQVAGHGGFQKVIRFIKK